MSTKLTMFELIVMYPLLKICSASRLTTDNYLETLTCWVHVICNKVYM